MYKLYVSGQLTLFGCPDGDCGEWVYPGFLSSHASWHRVLDANAFLWLREAIRREIESGRLAGQSKEATERLGWIAECGIAYKAFTADQIAEGRQAPAWFSFNMNLPRWVDDVDLLFCSDNQGWWSVSDDARMAGSVSAGKSPESYSGAKED